MSYTKAQLEARVQTLSEVLEAFDVAHFERMWFTQQWTRDYRESLYNRLVAARKALAEAEEEDEPYAPSEAYLNALRSFGFTDEDCAKEIQNARDCDFELTLADEVRKAYDEGDSQGYSKGYNTGYDWGKKLGKAEGKAEGYDEGYDAGWDDGYTSARKFWKPED